MARFVDLEEDEDAGAGPGAFPVNVNVNDPRPPHHEVLPPIPPALESLHHDDPQQTELSQKDQHLLLLRKLDLLSSASNSRNGPWPHSLYNPEPLGTMDASTFQAPITNAFQCYP